MKTVLFDTNMLLLPFTHGIDIFAQTKTIVPFTVQFGIVDYTIDELHELMEQKKTKKPAKAALALIEEKITVILKHKDLYTKQFSDPIVDHVLVSQAGNDTLVATRDNGIIAQLKQKQVPYITVQSKRLVLTHVL